MYNRNIIGELSTMNRLEQFIFRELSTFTIIFLISCSNAWCSDGDNELSLRLDLLRKHYKNFPSVHFKATSRATHKRDKFEKEVIGKTQYTYWGDGQKYRMNVSSGPEADPSSWSTLEVAFDDKRHQNFSLADSILRYQKEDTDVVVGVPPNPMLYPVLFLSPSVQNMGRRLRVKDLYEDRTWQNILSHARVVSSSLSAGELEFEIPGGKAYGEATESVFRVRLGADPSFMPVEIKRVSNDGGILCRISIPSYNVTSINGEEKYTPQEVRMENMYAGKTVVTEIVSLDSVELGSDLPAGIFTIDYTRADVIYDEDYRLVIDTPGRTMPTLYSENISNVGPTDQVELSEGSSRIDTKSVEDVDIDMSVVGVERAVSSPRRPWWMTALWMMGVFVILILSMVYCVRKKNQRLPGNSRQTID
jgi:hypothetical protein